jgi:ketosteroid isomerase-like protein
LSGSPEKTEEGNHGPGARQCFPVEAAGPPQSGVLRRFVEIEGDYVGLTGIGTFFETLGAQTGGTFAIEPIMVTAAGDELVVTHTRNTMTFRDGPVATDAVVVWRVVDGRIAEVWDIPSVHTTANPGRT